MPVITQPAELPKASAVQPVSPETPLAQPVPNPAPETPEQKLSAKYLEQARLEKIRRKEADTFKAKEQAWLQKEEEYKSKYIPKDQLEKDAFGTLKSLGWDDQKIMNTLMNQPAPQDQMIMQLQAKIQELEEGQKKTLTTFEEQQNLQRENAITMIRNKAKQVVEASPEEFEMIHKTNSFEAVAQLVVDTWDTEKRAISEEEAAKEIEDYLLEQYLPILETKKIQSKFTPPQETQPQQVSAKQNTSPLKTLTHGGAPATQKPLSAMSRRERAILAYKGQLPS